MCSLTLYVLPEGLSGTQRRELVNSYLPLSLSVCLSVCLPVFLSQSVPLSVFHATCLSHYLSVCCVLVCWNRLKWFLQLSDCGTVCLSDCCTVCLSDLSVWLNTVCLTRYCLSYRSAWRGTVSDCVFCRALPLMFSVTLDLTIFANNVRSNI